MTLIAFTPSNAVTSPFQALMVLDGSTYQAIATWNVYAQRWYLALTDQNGNLAWNGPIVGSSMDFDIPLAPGIFQASTVLYREDTGNFEVSP